MSSSNVNLIKDRKTKSFATTWLQTIKRLMPGIHAEPLTKEQYEQSLVLVIDSSADYIPFSEIFASTSDEIYEGGLSTILPLVMWIFIFIFIEAAAWKKIVSFII